MPRAERLSKNYERPNFRDSLSGHYGRHPALFDFVGTRLKGLLSERHGGLTVWDVGIGWEGVEPFELASHLEGSDYKIVGVDFVRRAVLSAAVARSLSIPVENFYEREAMPQYPMGFFSEGKVEGLEVQVPVPEEVRRRLSFIHADALFANPKERPNLILALNSLQYHSPARRAALLENFASALKPGGFLVTGPFPLEPLSKTVGKSQRLAPLIDLESTSVPPDLARRLGLREVKEPFEGSTFKEFIAEKILPFRYQVFEKLAQPDLKKIK